MEKTNSNSKGKLVGGLSIVGVILLPFLFLLRRIHARFLLFPRHCNVPVAPQLAHHPCRTHNGDYAESTPAHTGQRDPQEQEHQQPLVDRHIEHRPILHADLIYILLSTSISPLLFVIIIRGVHQEVDADRDRQNLFCDKCDDPPDSVCQVCPLANVLSADHGAELVGQNPD